MKATKHIRTVAVAVLLAVVMLGLCICASAQGADPVFESKYAWGAEISIPAYSFTAEGRELAAAAMVQTPSGTVYSVKDTFVPAEEGLHTLRYVAYDSQGNRYCREYSFTVTAPLYSVGDSRSELSLGKYQYGSYTGDRTAILASIASLDTFRFSQVIDLEELAGESFLEFFVTPETIGTNDVGKIDIVLTDLYDPENFVTISIKRGVGSQTAAWLVRTSYITANSASQAPTGLERNKGDLVIGDTSYLLHKNNVWGAGVLFALSGDPGFASAEQPNALPEKVGSQTLALSMDLQTNAIYANGQLVTILSSEQIYGKDIWEGFTTGECLMSISGVNYNASALNLAITKLGTETVEQNGNINAQLEKNEFLDTGAPVIRVDCPQELPNAVTGVPYKLFAATASDDYTSAPAVHAAVYLRYGQSNAVRVDVCDGSFTPHAPGVYTLVYTSTDHYGNVGTQILEITAEPADAASLQAQLQEPAKAVAGVSCTIPVPVFTDARGQVSWHAVAEHSEGKVSYEISAEDPTFFPEYAGTYRLIYSFGDYVFESTVTKELTVQANDKPIFMEDPVLPLYILRGSVYTLPELDVRVYSTGEPVAAWPQIYVIEDGGQEKLADYRYVSYAQESIQFIYRLENQGECTEYASAVLPVLDVGYNGIYKIDKYFDCDGLTAEPYGKYVRLRPENGTAAGRATFANALQTFNFSIRMSAGGKGFDTISLYLTDYTDSSVTVKFTYRNSGGAVYFSINDGPEKRLADAQFNNADLPLALNLNADGTQVMPTGISSLVYDIDRDLSGNAFTGFKRNLAYLTLEVDGIQNPSQTAVDVYNICNQIISGIYVDNIKPAISASSAVGARPAGTEYVIEPVYYADVLDPAAACVMYVLAPDGNYAVTVDGISLDKNVQTTQTYTLRFDQIGDYTVHYEVTDISGNVLTYSYVLKSADVTRPEVQILSPVTAGKVNTAIPVAGIQITDNFDTTPESFTTYACVITPQGQIWTLDDGTGKTAGSFTVHYAGVYTVQYMVMDSSGNLTLAEYKVEVQ